jgi:hypothetical protein
MKRFLPLTITLFASLGASEWAARAATYNFYFNNTEQGDNSTATPTVTVSDGKAEKRLTPQPASAAPVATPVAPPEPVAAPVAAFPGASSTAVIPEGPGFLGSDRTAHFRLTAGVGEVFEADSAIGPFFDLGLFANRYVGVNFYVGVSQLQWDYWWQRSSTVIGGELELTPLHLGTGAHPDLLELGVLLGASNLYPAEDNWVAPHLGGRLSVNFGNYAALTAVVRGNAGTISGETGLALRL